MPSFGTDIQRADAGIMEVITLAIDDAGCGRLQFELPADATAEEVAYIASLVPHIATGLLDLRDPGTGVFHRDGKPFAVFRTGAHCDDARSALFRHRLTGIDQEIDEDLLKLDPVPSNRRQARLCLEHQRDVVLRQFALDQ